MTKKLQYNEKPSTINNIGVDFESKRHAFNTYESESEKKERIAKNKEFKKSLIEIKRKILSNMQIDNPRDLIIDYLEINFLSSFDQSSDSFYEAIKEERSLAVSPDEVAYFNKKVRALNKIRTCKSHHYYADRELRAFIKRNLSKNKRSFIEQNGIFYEWVKLEESSNAYKNKMSEKKDIKELSEKVEAVQFGNSVTDFERALVLRELNVFIDSIAEKFNANTKKIKFAFGSRGRRGSMGYFLRSQNIISTNRNTIGVLCHEMGHFLDYENNLISNRISSKTVREYAKKIKEIKMTPKERRYYLSPVEIFARAFEEYCLKNMNLNDFSLTNHGRDLNPDLNLELVSLIERLLKK